MSDTDPLFDIVRQAIAAKLAGKRYHPRPLDPPYYEARGVFVTLREEDGRLRGCIGHLEPYCRDLAEELATTAVSAATQDPRFPPVSTDELPGLSIELSLLEPSEPTVHEELDPARYGVIVHQGKKRGVLLPEVVDTAEEQVRVARRKAGIGVDEPYELRRFEVTKLVES